MKIIITKNNLKNNAASCTINKNNGDLLSHHICEKLGMPI